MNGSEILMLIENRFKAKFVRRFRFPFLIAEIRDECFESVAEDDRESTLAGQIGVASDQLSADSDRLFFRFDLGGTHVPRSSIPDSGESWIRQLTAADRIWSPVAESDKDQIRSIHFYGYKGGQARSSVLCFLASTLSENGWKVLMVDADGEAPSLDILMKTNIASPEASAVGLRSGLEPRAIRVLGGKGEGAVDLLGFRPSDSRYDIDAAALCLEQSLSPSSLSKIAVRIRDYVAKNGYDVVLIDHRTGLSGSVLPWVRELPGPVAVFARMDEQWKPARAHTAVFMTVDWRV